MVWRERIFVWREVDNHVLRMNSTTNRRHYLEVTEKRIVLKRHTCSPPTEGSSRQNEIVRHYFVSKQKEFSSGGKHMDSYVDCDVIVLSVHLMT